MKIRNLLIAITVVFSLLIKAQQPNGTGNPPNFADTHGELSVSAMGAANYTLPIALPPGIKNTAPQIALVYNSTSDNGMAGYGWNLTGISSISRVSSRIDLDGYAGGVNLDSRDKLSLDGQRLLIKTGNYGEAGAVYQTENYSQLKIETQGNLSREGIPGTSPEYFKVTFPDGAQAWYGSTEDSRGVTEWLIKKWKDPQGNFIEYTYEKDRNTTYINKIIWGGNENQSTGYSNTIQFYYTQRKRSEFAYVQGIKLVNNRILDRVEVFSGGELFKKYQLTHQTVTGNYQRISSIQEFNSDNQPANPVTFAHNNTSNSFSSYQHNKSDALADIKNIRLTGDFDGDGQADVITTGGVMYKNLFENLGSGNNRISLNIDSERPPVERPIMTLTDNQLNPFQSLVTYKNEVPSGTSATNPERNREKKLVLTVNNFSKSLNNFEPVYTRKLNYPYGGSKTDQCQNVKHVPGKGWTGNTVVTYDTPIDFKYLEGDFNGDGISELIALGQETHSLVKLNNIRILNPFNSFTNPFPDDIHYDPFSIFDTYINTYNCTNAAPEYVNIEPYYIDMNPSVPDTQSYRKLSKELFHYDTANYVADINGDGKAEILSFHGKSGKYKVSALNQNGEFTVLFEGSFSEYDGEKPLLAGDLNGDGKTDFMIPEALNSSTWIMYISTGKGFEKLRHDNLTYYEPQWKGRPSANRYKGRQYHLADLNKDGKSDFIESEYESWTVSPGDRDGRGYIRYNENMGGGDKPSFAAKMEAEVPRSEYGYEDPFTLIIADYKNNEKTGNYVFVQGREIWKGNFYKDLRKDLLITRISEAGGNQVSQIDYAPLEPNTGNNGLGDENGVYFSSGKETYPYREIRQIPNMDVVKKVSVTAAGKTLYQQYKYFGLVSHTRGLGLLGFKKTARSNWLTDESLVHTPIWSVQEMYPQLGRDGQTYSPLISAWTFKGSDYSQITHPKEAQLLSKTSTKFHCSRPAPGVIRNLPETQTQKDFLTGVTLTTENQYDTYGNLTRSILKNGAGTFQTDYTYIHNPGGTAEQYYMGRLVRKAETAAAYSDTYSSEENYAYTGNLITQTRKKGKNTDEITEDLSYDGFGNLIQKTLSAPGLSSRTVKDQYDSSGRFVIKKTDADNLTEVFAYNNWGQVVSHLSPLGVATLTQYDGWGKLRKITTTGTSDVPLVSITDYERTANGGIKITAYSEQTGEYSALYKDFFGREIKGTVKGFSPGSYISQSTEYDALGRKTRESEPYFDLGEGTLPSQWNTTEYDELSRPVKQKLFTGKTVAYSYNKLSVTTRDGARSKTITKDANGNIIKVSDNGEVLTYTYYADGNRKTSGYNGHTVTLKYDGWGRKVSLLDPSVSSIPYTYSYNNYGELLTEATPDGVTSYRYSPTGKILTKTVTGANTHIQTAYEYSDQGLLLKETGTSGGEAYSYVYSYDEKYRLASHKETTPKAGYTREYTYDPLGRSLGERMTTAYENLNSFVYTQNVYNEYNGMQDKVVEAETGKTLWELKGMNERMQTVSARLGNGAAIANRYDSYGFVKEMVHAGEVSAPLSLGYEFDPQRGWLISRSNRYFNRNEQFAYDNFDRLVSWSDPDGTYFNSYSSDGRIEENSQVGKYYYDTSARYQKTSIGLNAEGGAYYASLPRQKITYNVYKNPVEITEGSSKVTFGYTIHATRTRAAVVSKEGAFTKFYSDDKRVEIVSKTTSSGKETRIITWLSGSPYEAPVMYVSTFRSSGAGALQKAEEAFYYLHRDYQGSILAISNEQGQTLERRHYDPWGKVVKATDKNGQLSTDYFLLITDRGYTGHEHFFAVGLIHMNGRMYDPVLRQFLSPDNFIQDGMNPQNYNRYGYVMNNPLMYTDPSGEFAWAAVAVAAGIGALIGGVSYTAYALYTDTFSWGGFAKSVALGGVSGTAAYGVGALSGVMNTSICASTQTLTATQVNLITAGIEAVLNGVTQGAVVGISGGNMVQGMASGAMASGVSSAVQMGGTAVGINGSKTVGTLFFGTVSGGFGSVLTGGNFWQGAASGLVVSGLNHVAHQLTESYYKSVLRTQVEKAYGKEGAEALAKKDISYIESMVEKVPLLKKMTQYISNIKYEIANESGIGADGTLTHAETSTTLIKLYDEAFASNLFLAAVLGHEFIHVQDYVFGNTELWKSDYGNHGDTALYIHYRSEMEAWTWTFSNANDIFIDAFSRWEDYSWGATKLWNNFNKGKKWKY